MSVDLTDESQVKEYIKNLGTEYRFGCYGEKKPEVCHLLGDYLEAVSKDYEKAGKVYRTNCDDFNYPQSCRKTAAYYLLGKGGLSSSSDKIKAAKYYEKGCDLGDRDSCFRSGLLNIMFANTSKNKSSTVTSATYLKGVEQLGKSCKDGMGDACYHLSALFMDGGEEVTDMRKAFNYAVEACRLGSVPACHNVSLMYRKGDGVSPDTKKSEEYKKRAAELQQEIQNSRQLLFQQGLPPVSSNDK